MHSTFVVTVLYCGQESFISCYKILYLFYGPVPLSGTLACSMRRLQFGNCQTCCRFFFYCRFRFFSLQFIIWAECYWIGNPPPPSPLTLLLFYLPYPRLRLIYSSSFACGLDLLEIKPYSTMMTRGKRSSTARASNTQVKRPRASSTSRPTKSKRPKQTSRVHSVPALNPPEVPHPSELSREPAISGPSSVSTPAASSSVVSQNMVSSITSENKGLLLVTTTCVLYLHYIVAFTLKYEIPETKRFIPKEFELGTTLS